MTDENKTEKPKKLSEADFALTEQVQGFWTCQPPTGTKPEDLENPIFWSHVARFMQPLSEIRAMPKDGSWYGLFICTYCDRVQARVKKLKVWRIDMSVDVDLGEEKYYVKYISPAPDYRFGIFRRADNEVMEKGFHTKGDALRKMGSMK